MDYSSKKWTGKLLSASYLRAGDARLSWGSPSNFRFLILMAALFIGLLVALFNA